MNLFNFVSISDLMKIGSGYGIIQVLAQDLGIKTGKKQRDLIQTIPVQFFVLYSSAFTIVANHRLALIIVSIYYLLKYVYSEGETSKVCFEDI